MAAIMNCLMWTKKISCGMMGNGAAKQLLKQGQSQQSCEALHLDNRRIKNGRLEEHIAIKHFQALIN